MTEFMGLTKNLMHEKWKLMNWILGIDLLALVAYFILRFILGGYKTSLNPFPNYSFAVFAVSLSIVNIVAVIMLSRNNERVLTSNNYRLIPATETKLYFSNLLTTLLGFVYLQILESIIGGILYGVSVKGAVDMTPSGSGSFSMLMAAVFVMILGALALWSGVTVVHLLINWIGGFLPFGRQKFVSFILYLLVTWLSLTIINFATGNVFKLIFHDGQFYQFSVNTMSSALWTSAGVLFVWVVIFAAINIYLLKRWTETIR